MFFVILARVGVGEDRYLGLKDGKSFWSAEVRQAHEYSDLKKARTVLDNVMDEDSTLTQSRLNCDERVTRVFLNIIKCSKDKKDEVMDSHVVYFEQSVQKAAPLICRQQAEMRPNNVSDLYQTS